MTYIPGPTWFLYILEDMARYADQLWPRVYLRSGQKKAFYSVSDNFRSLLVISSNLVTFSSDPNIFPPKKRFA